MVEAAQAIIENRWHKPTAKVNWRPFFSKITHDNIKDLDLAKSVDNDVYKYLNDRQSAALSLHDDDGDLDLVIVSISEIILYLPCCKRKILSQNLDFAAFT